MPAIEQLVGSRPVFIHELLPEGSYVTDFVIHCNPALTILHFVNDLTCVFSSVQTFKVCAQKSQANELHISHV